MQMIFQDPISSLNPRRKVREIVASRSASGSAAPRPSAQRRSTRSSKRWASTRARRREPAHQFSGGQCQRISIARSLVLDPSLIICDEPVSALDVSVQAQVLNLLEDLKAKYGLTLVFIAHDLAVVKNISDRVAVMYLGKICEVAPSDDAVRRAGAPLHEGAARLDPGARPRDRGHQDRRSRASRRHRCCRRPGAGSTRAAPPPTTLPHRGAHSCARSARATSWPATSPLTAGLIAPPQGRVAHPARTVRAMDTLTAATRWATTWERSWTAGDVASIAALYRPDASYRSHPHREPEQGGALAYVSRTFAEESQVWCRFGPPMATGGRAAVEWWACFDEEGTPITLSGATVLTFDDDGLVVDHVDYWVQADGRRLPFTGWAGLAEPRA
jgi:energy-coupling factor transporter ATP-binding protein EcfA2